MEKIQHTVPYVNPHPNNCVCPHVGYQVTSLPLPVAGPNLTTANNGSPAPSARSGSSPPAAASRVTSAQDKDGDENNTAATDEGTTAGDSSVLPDNTSSDSSPPLSSDKSFSHASSSSISPSPSSQSDGEQQKAITASTGSSSVENVVSPQDKNSIDSSPNDAPASHTDIISSNDSESQVPGKSSSITEEPSDSNPTDLPDNCDRLNTAILGPSEIRRGITEAITEKNATIFRYSTIHIPKRKTNSDNEGVDNEELVEDNEKSEETKEKDEEVEGGTDVHVDEEEAKASPEPYNPYVDYELCDMDLPLVARLLRNVEPNFLWTWTRDSISFKHLSREQVVNRFPNTPFTTKVSTEDFLQD